MELGSSERCACLIDDKAVARTESLSPARGIVVTFVIRPARTGSPVESLVGAREGGAKGRHLVDTVSRR